MSNKSNDLVTFLAGAAAGAAAVFFSKKDNRDKTQKTIEDLKKQVDRLSRQYQEDPQKLKDDLISGGRQVAVKVTSETAKAADRASKALQTESDMVEKEVVEVKPKRKSEKKSS